MSNYYIFTVEFFSSENPYGAERTEKIIASDAEHGSAEGALNHAKCLAVEIAGYNNYFGSCVTMTETFSREEKVKEEKPKIEIAGVHETYIQDEWDYILDQVAHCVNSDRFHEYPTTGTLVDRICRNKRAEKFIQKVPRRGITKQGKLAFINAVLDCIIESGNSPVSREDGKGNRIRVAKSKGWGDIPMNEVMREIILNALKLKGK